VDEDVGGLRGSDVVVVELGREELDWRTGKER
jgi:hypothetical protein